MRDTFSRTGILLVNLGSPKEPSVAAVREYLKEFLSDPYVVPVPRLLWWIILHGWILNTRPAKSAEKNLDPLLPADDVTAVTGTPVRMAHKASTEQKNVFAVLDNATRGDLNRLQAVWADVVAQLNVSQKAILSTAKPIAASSQGVLLGFDFEIFRDKTKQDQMLVDTLNSQIRKLTETTDERNLVLVTNDEWPEIRNQWIQQHRKNRPVTESAAIPEAEMTATDLPVQVEETHDQTIVQAAKDLFGDEMVEVKAD